MKVLTNKDPKIRAFLESLGADYHNAIEIVLTVLPNEPVTIKTTKLAEFKESHVRSPNIYGGVIDFAVKEKAINANVASMFEKVQKEVKTRKKK